MIYCNKCNTEHPDDTPYCLQCGTAIQINSQNNSNGTLPNEISLSLNPSIPNQVKREKPVNPIADILYKIGAFILILGVIAAVIIIFAMKDPLSSSYSPDPHPLRWVYGLALFASSFISGFLLIGFGEAIRLLTDIRENTKK